MAKKNLFPFHFESDFRIVGVFCLENDYRLSWLMNNRLLFDFKRTIDFGFYSEKLQQPANHSVFHCEQDTLQRSFFLLNNHSYEGSTLFAKPPGINFLMLLKAERYDIKDLLKKLRSLPQVTAAYQLDDALGKHKESFLYDFEMYLGQELKM